MQNALNLLKFKKNNMSNVEGRGTDTPPKWRAWMHMAMGVVYLLFAALIFNVKKFASIDLGPASAYVFSALLALYGVFRIWRGYTDLKQIGGQQ
jgi:uncharacterized membrane protein HdeD (DUF308 family)